VTISGRVGQKSAVAGLVTAALQIEGVTGVDPCLTWAVDGCYPITPISW
jgi:hypothetical protein